MTSTTTYLVHIATVAGPYLLAGLASMILSRKSQIDAWAEANPKLAGLLKLLRAFGFDPWMAVQGATLVAKGRLPAKVTAAAGNEDGKPDPSVVAEIVNTTEVKP